jgi:hypothetical protein
MKHNSSDKRKLIRKLIKARACQHYPMAKIARTGDMDTSIMSKNFCPQNHNISTEIQADYTFHYFSDPLTYCLKDPVLKHPQAVFFP